MLYYPRLMRIFQHNHNGHNNLCPKIRANRGFFNMIIALPNLGAPARHGESSGEYRLQSSTHLAEGTPAFAYVLDLTLSGNFAYISDMEIGR
jgi:hypothetical protein